MPMYSSNVILRAPEFWASERRHSMTSSGRYEAYEFGPRDPLQFLQFMLELIDPGFELRNPIGRA